MNPLRKRNPIRTVLFVALVLMLTFSAWIGDTVAAPGDITTIAGGGVGDTGAATSASLYLPRGLHITASGEIYIADTLNHRIRKIDANGIITTVAGNGIKGFAGDGGPATNASLNYPMGVTVDQAGNIYIADAHNHRVRKVNTSGIISTIIGGGIENSAQYCSLPATDINISPRNIFLDSFDRVYTTDGHLWRLEPDGTLVNLSDPGCGYGSLVAGFSTGFFDVSGTFTYVSANSVYRTTDMQDSILLGSFAAAPLGIFTTVSGDLFGNIYVASPQLNVVYKLDTVGTWTILTGTGAAGYSGDGGDAVSANINNPTDVAVDALGNIYIADRMNHRIRKVDTNGKIMTVGGTGEAGYAGDGLSATSERLNLPGGVFADSSGNVYIADTSNHRVRKIDTSGIMTTIAGSGTAEFSGDGGPASSAGLYYPTGIFVNSDGTIYIADSFNDRIRKVDPTGVITTIAGTEDTGYEGDGGSATLAALNYPTGVAVDSVGNILIADFGNNAIRKIDASGIISTYANIINPRSIALDSSGVLYVATNYDGVNKVNPDGTVEFISPYPDVIGVAVDSADSVYMACQSQHTIIKSRWPVAAPEVIAGTGIEGFSGDGGPANAAMLASPSSVFVDFTGAIYIADSGNSRIRRIAGKLEPSVAIQSPAAGFTNNATPLLLYTTSSGTAVVKVDGIEINKVSGNYLDPLADGSHSIRVEVTNDYGTGYAERTFTVDTVPPVVTITSPTPGTTRDTQPLLTYTASEGIVTVKVDGVVVNKVSGNRLDMLSNGTHSVRVEARDAAENIGFADVTFTIAALPIVTMNSPSGGSTNNATPLLSYIASNGTVVVTVDGIVVGKVSGDILDPLADGTHTVRVEVSNDIGTVFSEQTFTVDTASPLVTITSPIVGLTNNNVPLLAYTVSDGQVAVRVDGIPVAKVSGDILDHLSDGSHVVRVEALDAAGNLGVAEVILIVDTISPDGGMIISSRGNHTLLVAADGKLWGWGDNFYGQIGDDTYLDKHAPVQIPGVWLSVSTGYDHSAGIKSDGTLWGWGNNNYGQVGDNTYGTRYSPVPVWGGGTWIAVSCGYYHSAAIKSDGTLWAWGYNSTGQIGDGTRTNRLVPVKVGTDNHWVAVSAGANYTIALKSDGTIWAWGFNYYGQLGDGTTFERDSPVQIGGSTWIAISANAGSTFALKKDGTLWAWGYNSTGQLGDGTTTSPSLPVQVGSDARWRSVDSGLNHTAAIKSDGTLWTWGANTYGQLGDGTTTSSTTPVQVGSDNDWNSAAVGLEHTAAVKSGQLVETWGHNTYGQLGDGTVAGKSFPTFIMQTNTVQINNAATYSTSTSVTLNFLIKDRNGVAEVQILTDDGNPWSPPIPFATTMNWTLGSADGIKTVYVKFKDNAGNWSAAYSDTITLDTTAPTVTISSPASGTTSDTQPLLTYAVNDGTVTVKVDGVTVSKVSGNRLDPLSSGMHTVHVESRDVAGNIGFTEVTFTVALPPTVAINSPTAASMNTNTPLLSYTASSGSVVVKVDGIAVSKVSGDTLDPLADGPHTVRVEATDANGTGFAERIFTVDTVVPVVAISSPTAGTTADNQPLLTYTVSEGVVVVKVDGIVVSKTSGNRLNMLSDASHVVRVESTDAAGNIGFSEVVFTVDTPPAVSISSPAAGATNDTTPILTYTVSNGTVVVKVDGVVVNKVSGDSLDPLADGSHTVRIEATDTAGTGYAERTFTVDTHLPFVVISSPTATTLTDNQPLLTYTASDSTITVKVDGVIVNKMSGERLFMLSNGIHTVRVDARDAAGNTAFDEVTFTVDAATTVAFIDDQESGTAKWSSSSGLWHVVDGTSPYPNSHSTSHSWWYGQDATGNYSTGGTNSGEVVSSTFSVPNGASLTFWSWEQTESSGTVYDTRKVYISTNNGSTWTQLFQSTDNTATWHPVTIDLASYAGMNAQLKFAFNSVDPVSNAYRGWYVDDVSVAGAGSPPPSGGATTEDFETGKLTHLPWVTSGNASWTVQTATKHSGAYAAEAPVSLADSQSAALELSQNCTAGNVTFWYSVSSETNYDYLRFYIDGLLKGQWSGPIPWTQASYPVSAGTHVFKWIYSKDGSISQGSDVAWIDDIVIPGSAALPTVTITSPGTFTNSSTPVLAYTATSGVIVVKVDDVVVDKVSGDVLGPLADGSHVVRVEATDVNGTGFAEKTFTVDTIAPSVSIASPVAGITNNNQPAIIYTVGDGSVVVKVDGTVVQKVSGNTLDPLAEGAHIVRVESTDAAGNIGFAEVGFTIDTTAPVVSISSPISGATNTTRPVLAYTANEGNVVVKVDGVVVGKVSGSTLDTLFDGPHTVGVEATDTANNTGYAEVSFTVDTAAPTITITSPAAGLTKKSAPVLEYTTSDGTVVVKVDGGIVNKVSGSTLDTLPDGPHTVRVEATDSANNAGFVEVFFTVDTAAPTITITSPATGPTKINDPVLEYIASDGTAVVKVDGIVVNKLSGNRLDILSEGSHTVSVESSDLAGNVGFAEVTFVVDTIPPAVGVDPVSSPTNVSTQTIAGSREAGAVITVVLNTTAAAGTVSYPTTATWSCTITGLVEGINSATVTAQDAAGNSATSAVSIAYDSVAPVVTITSPLVGSTVNNRPTLVYSANDGIVTVLVDGVAVSKVSGDKLDALANGAHSVRVEARDAANNTGFAEVSFTVNYTSLAVATTSLGWGVIGTSYSQQLSASGGVTPYTWSISGGALPAGLSLDPATGTISGLPTAAGAATFTVQALDANQTAALQQLTINIYTPLTVGTTSLAAGYAGEAYTRTLTAAGGLSPYGWSISSGTLPAGLTLDGSTGVISGTPAGAGTSTFTVQVQDVNQTTNTANLSITVNAARPDLVVTSVSGPSSGRRGYRISVTVTVKNQGNAIAPGSTVTLYLSADGTITTSDIKLSDKTVTTLTAGSSQTITTNVTIPSSMSKGTFYIGAIADRTGVVTESDENNNSKAGNTLTVN